MKTKLQQVGTQSYKDCKTLYVGSGTLTFWIILSQSSSLLAIILQLTHVHDIMYTHTTYNTQT